jgi:hypothetical protein
MDAAFADRLPHPGLLVTKVTPFGPACVTCGVIRAMPFGKKMPGAGPPGVIAFQTPTIGWFASASASCADAWCVDAAMANPRPPAPSPARAVRRVTRESVVDLVICWILLLDGATVAASRPGG